MRTRTRHGVVILGAIVSALVLTAFSPALAFAKSGGSNVSDAWPILSLPFSTPGALDATDTVRDTFSVNLTRGQTLDASITVTNADPGTNFDLLLYKPSVTSISETSSAFPAMWGNGPLHEHFTFMAADPGKYTLDVFAWKGAGDYLLDVKIVPAVKFSVGSLSVPKSAKKGRRVKVSAIVRPAYNGVYTPVYFYFYRYEHGKYRRKAIVDGTGIRNPGEALSKLTATYKFPKTGKWRVRAEFWDEAHYSKFTSYKYIRIK